MSATAGFARQASELDKLLALASLNKADIAANGEEMRRQLQLTQAKESEIATAKAYIDKHAYLSADLQRRENELAENKNIHSRIVEDFNNHVKSENTRLERFSSSLDARQKVLADSETSHASEIKNFSATKSEYERQHREAMANVKIAENANIEIGKTLAAENQRLKEWETLLKRKAENIRQQAASF